jgi:hypothetical protein
LVYILIFANFVLYYVGSENEEEVKGDDLKTLDPHKFHLALDTGLVFLKSYACTDLAQSLQRKWPNFLFTFDEATDQGPAASTYNAQAG